MRVRQLAWVAPLALLGACVSTLTLDRPGGWPAPTLAAGSGCKAISASFSDRAAEQIPEPRYSYESETLADLFLTALWTSGNGRVPWTGGKATLVQLSISTERGLELKVLKNDVVVATVSTTSPTQIRCDAGRFVFDKKATGATEGTTSRNAWIWNVYQAESGDLIVQQRRATYQSSMLVVHAWSTEDRWLRFARLN